MAVQKSPAPLGGRVLQCLGRNDIDYKLLYALLSREGVAIEIRRVRLFFFSGGFFLNENLDNTGGITFPYEDPPHVYINLAPHTSTEQLAATIYHEVNHAFDPETPLKEDESKTAKDQDMANETKTWRKEVEYTIRMGGSLLQELIADKVVIEKDGFLIPNPAKFDQQALSGLGYDEYLKQSRRQRFNLKNYKFIDAKEFLFSRVAAQFEKEISKEEWYEHARSVMKGYNMGDQVEPLNDYSDSYIS